MSTVAARFNRAWLSRGPLVRLLWPLSLLMTGLVWARRLAYHQGWMRSVKLPVPVIVVGNRVVGGAGKTPTTIALLQRLQSTGWRPGVLSRGYKAQGADGASVLIDAQTAQHVNALETGDEPLLIWRRTGAPVMVGRDRVLGGQALLRKHPDINVLVCDDGLQHLRLQRDVEVVVFDERGQGNGWLLPAGPLREPIDAPAPPGLRAPPIVIYNAARTSTTLPGHLASKGLVPLQALSDWWGREPSDSQRKPPTQGRTVWAVAGIAHPQRFFDALASSGLVVQGVPLADHADFSTLPWPVEARDVVVTEKDAIKLRPERIQIERPGCQVWVAALDFQPDEAFWTALDAALSPWPEQTSPNKPSDASNPH